MSLNTDWKVGDVLSGRRATFNIEIVDVTETGYGFKYHDVGDIRPDGEKNYFRSEDHGDPDLAHWRRVPPVDTTTEPVVE